jgi:hypothetical protein
MQRAGSVPFRSKKGFKVPKRQLHAAHSQRVLSQMKQRAHVLSRLEVIEHNTIPNRGKGT